MDAEDVVHHGAQHPGGGAGEPVVGAAAEFFREAGPDDELRIDIRLDEIAVGIFAHRQQAR